MTSERQLQDTILAHGLGVQGCELPKVSRSMQELHDIQVDRLKSALDEANYELTLVRALARDKDRERRKHISTLYMALGFMAGFAGYLGFKG